MAELSKSAQYMRAIERTRNLSTAADELGISQPALSAYLKKLEKRLGTTLFDRQQTPLVITEAGQAYLDYEDDSWKLRRELGKRISDIEDMRVGKLVVGGATSFNISCLPVALAEFSQAYPGIDVEVVDDTVPQIMQRALDGQIDVFVTPESGLHDAFEREILRTEKVFVAVPKDWPVVAELPPIGDEGFARIGKAEFKLLADLPFITLRPRQQLGQMLASLFVRYDVRLARTIVAEQALTSLALTVAGVGISLTTESTVFETNQKHLPALYLADESICARNLYVAWPKNAHLSKAGRTFVGLLVKHGAK